MSWFEISLKEFRGAYTPLSPINEEVQRYSFFSRSISDFDALTYVYLLIGIIFAGLVLFALFRRVGGEVKGFSRIIFLLCAVISLYGLYVLTLLWNVPVGGIPEKLRDGAFGDSFGTLNTLFSGLAFSGVLITLLIQKIDLSEARTQSSRQQSESQFYNLLNLQQQVIQGFDIHLESGRATPKTLLGRDCFRYWRGKLKRRYNPKRFEGRENGTAQMAAYDSVLQAHLGDLGLYFRSLYAVFRYIETTAIEDRKHFALVVRSLLSDYELIFLFYNCLSDKGSKFKVYAEKYALFDNLDVGLLLSVDDVALMSVEAFGENEEALNIKSIFSR
ncbi:hypothetical protein D3C81_295770 [compost metagenome]